MTIKPENNPNYHAALAAIAAGHRVIMVDDNGEPLSAYNKNDATDRPDVAYLWWLVNPSAKCGIAEDGE